MWYTYVSKQYTGRGEVTRERERDRGEREGGGRERGERVAGGRERKGGKDREREGGRERENVCLSEGAPECVCVCVCVCGVCACVCACVRACVCGG